MNEHASLYLAAPLCEGAVSDLQLGLSQVFQEWWRLGRLRTILQHENEKCDDDNAKLISQANLENSHTQLDDESTD